MTTIGFVRILLALAAYLKVFNVSQMLDDAGEIHAIYKRIKLISKIH